MIPGSYVLVRRGFQLQGKRVFQTLVGSLSGLCQLTRGLPKAEEPSQLWHQGQLNKGCVQASSSSSSILLTPAILQPCQGAALLQDCPQPSSLTQLPNRGAGHRACRGQGPPTAQAPGPRQQQESWSVGAQPKGRSSLASSSGVKG